MRQGQGHRRIAQLLRAEKAARKYAESKAISDSSAFKVLTEEANRLAALAT